MNWGSHNKWEPQFVIVSDETNNYAFYKMLRRLLYQEKIVRGIIKSLFLWYGIDES